MIRQFPKGHAEFLSANFDLKEFHCHCTFPECKATYLSEELIESLQALRDLSGALRVLSAFRCGAHNKNVGGRPNSQHLLGIAVDVKPLETTRLQLLHFARRIPAFKDGGIGNYSWGIHVDVRGYRAWWNG